MGRLVALKGEHTAVKEMRRHLAWYLKGMKGGTRVKDMIMEETKRDEVARILEDYVTDIAAEPSDSMVTA
ncbi:tRNA-dihydrouridine synthase B [compost metagenome]